MNMEYSSFDPPCMCWSTADKEQKEKIDGLLTEKSLNYSQTETFLNYSVTKKSLNNSVLEK